MPSATWSNCERDFEPDGSLRDIYVLETSLADWERLLQALPSTYQLHFQSGDLETLPSTASEAFRLAQVQGALLKIDAEGIKVHCHFFWDRDIEFDVDPKEIASEREFRSLVSFMRFTGQALGKPVRLTPENLQEHRILEYHPATDCVVYYPPNHGSPDER